MPADVKPAVLADLTNGLKFTNFTPHPDIADDEVTGKQELTFFIQVPPPGPLQFQVGNTLETRDAKPYDPGRIDRKLTLGGVDEWTLQSHFVSHPFHIHVNPFQIVSIKDPMGNEVSAPGSQDKGDGVSVDPQYEGLPGRLEGHFVDQEPDRRGEPAPSGLVGHLHDQDPHPLRTLYRRICAPLPHPRP